MSIFIAYFTYVQQENKSRLHVSSLSVLSASSIPCLMTVPFIPDCRHLSFRFSFLPLPSPPSLTATNDVDRSSTKRHLSALSLADVTSIPGSLTLAFDRTYPRQQRRVFPALCAFNSSALYTPSCKFRSSVVPPHHSPSPRKIGCLIAESLPSLSKTTWRDVSC
jgi:hypothetical protein